MLRLRTLCCDGEACSSAASSTHSVTCCCFLPGIGVLKQEKLVLQVPWEDLRYMFGEIMYGGHIVEDWDRRLASAYLLKYFQDSLSEGLTLFPGFATPSNNLSYAQVRSSITRQACPALTPSMPCDVPGHQAALVLPCQGLAWPAVVSFAACIGCHTPITDL